MSDCRTVRRHDDPAIEPIEFCMSSWVLMIGWRSSPRCSRARELESLRQEQHSTVTRALEACAMCLACRQVFRDHRAVPLYIGWLSAATPRRRASCRSGRAVGNWGCSGPCGWAGVSHARDRTALDRARPRRVVAHCHVEHIRSSSWCGCGVTSRRDRARAVEPRSATARVRGRRNAGIRAGFLRVQA